MKGTNVFVMQSMAGGTHKTSHVLEGEPDLGPNNDLYEPFSHHGQDWLNDNQFLKCVYLLHIQYPGTAEFGRYGSKRVDAILLHQRPLNFSPILHQNRHDTGIS